MTIPKRIPEDAQGMPQAVVNTMQPADTPLGFHMGNTPLVFQNGKYHSGFPQREMHPRFLSDKPSRRHNGPQNSSTVFRGINPFLTLTPHSTPLQCPHREDQCFGS